MNEAAALRPAPRQSPIREVPLDSFSRGESAAEFAYRSLRNAILSLALPPGTLLSRNALASQLGVSQTPVREALIRLQDETLIEVVPHSATRVARIDLDNARQAQFLRRALELEVVRHLAATPDPAACAALRAELDRQQALLAARDEAGLSGADASFHGLLCAAAGMAPLWELVRSRSGHLDRLRRLDLPSPGKAEAVVADHRRILSAIEAGDGAAAEASLRAHLSGTFARLEAIRATRPEYF
jgi:DNA-binding GntR family transcriptional regulator